MKSLVSALLITISVLSAHAQMNGDGARTGAPDAFYLGAGAGVLDNLNSDDPAYQFVGGRLWRLTNLLGIKTVAEATTDFNDAVLASALVGANFYPVESKFSPYIGAAGGLGYANGDQLDDVFGLDLSSVVGMLLFRGSPVELKVEGNANFLFRDVAGEMPMTFTGRIALLF